MCALKGPEHIFEFANPLYFNLLGGRELIGKTVREAIPEVKDQDFEKLLDEAYRTGKAVSYAATPMFLAQLGGYANYFYVDFVYQPIMNSSGEVTGIFVMGSDVTAHVRAKELLLDDERRKDEFLSVLAHEFRNLLAPILTASEILIQTSEPNSMFASLSNLICRKMDKLTSLVDDLLDISRTEKKIDLKKEPLKLDDVAKLAIDSVQTLLAEKQLELMYEPGTRKLFIEGDRARIVQCLKNLLTNAIKYSDQGGMIQLYLREVDNTAVIEVIDNGVGIEPNMLPKIFDLFMQTKQTLRRAKSGLGIGLSIVHRLIQLHGGHVNAMSDGIGSGARFEICLPLIPEPSGRPEKLAEKYLSPMRLLIVDDNVDAADSLATLLRLKGHETVTAYSAEEAMRAAKIFPADIVLLDIELPDIDGYEVARRLRKNGSNSKLVALTGHGKPHDIQQAFDAGFSTHITKPVVFAELEYILSCIKQNRPLLVVCN
jgi:signal transduction histidine kinase/ActR/RegA family two-component response regulator